MVWKANGHHQPLVDRVVVVGGRCGQLLIHRAAQCRDLDAVALQPSTHLTLQ